MSPNLFRMEYEEFSSFYLHEMLKATPKDAIQDSAYVVLYPNKEMENKTLSLPMGARFGNWTTSIFLTRLPYADLATLCKSTHSQLFTFQPLLFSFGSFRALC